MKTSPPLFEAKSGKPRYTNLSACISEEEDGYGRSQALRRTRSGCCAHTASGQLMVATPSSVMNSRRLILIALVQ
jgi:hypothetical protein